MGRCALLAAVSIFYVRKEARLEGLVDVGVCSFDKVDIFDKNVVRPCVYPTQPCLIILARCVVFALLVQAFEPSIPECHKNL